MVSGVNNSLKQPIITLKNASTGYGIAQALWEITLELYPREIVALIGSNGAGKTTVLRVLSGVLPLWSGEYKINGEDVKGYTPPDLVNKGICHVPEGRQLFYGLSVEENLRMGAFALKKSRAEINERLEWIYNFFPEIAKRRNQLAGTLSGGEQQMVAIGRGLMGDPSILLIDELSLGLAPVIVDRIYETLQKIHREREITIMIVEQDMELALSVASRGYVLENGRISISGNSRDLINNEAIREAYLGV
ncbi:High-affinity branched-chain amino acid transport ATP-binding protein LivF [Moorella humiferrea]|uniref:High-affinity branched-chain amino acid transport ATP-binding protein LivF n=1 Tax=Neomoorella humiferrea TaxID=676965 RepID=A0A2T0AJU9_9FIRM|nr:ABC transporter ATP-binding protein [Moorella humiferrea]PRR68678.1 High-affinity branched-chain amino acid transport ATP-binding protein LivF [Moorella humiferrea]